LAVPQIAGFVKRRSMHGVNRRRALKANLFRASIDASHALITHFLGDAGDDRSTP